MPKNAKELFAVYYMNNHQGCEVDINNNFHFFIHIYVVHILKLNPLSAHFFVIWCLLFECLYIMAACIMLGICLLFVMAYPFLYALLI